MYRYIHGVGIVKKILIWYGVGIVKKILIWSHWLPHSLARIIVKTKLEVKFGTLPTAIGGNLFESLILHNIIVMGRGIREAD